MTDDTYDSEMAKLPGRIRALAEHALRLHPKISPEEAERVAIAAEMAALQVVRAYLYQVEG